MDLVRLQKALSVEAEHGFNNLEGNQYHFGEFLHLNFSQPDAALPDRDQSRCQEIASQFASYADLTFSQRQHLVAETRRFLLQVKKAAEETEKKSTYSADQPSAKKVIASPRTSPIVESNHNISLDQSLTYLPGVGPKSAEKLAKLGLLTVRDMLYYYPRDHLDYARQVTIRELKAGETVTLIGTVKS
jgi:ATP-dependent DNA helicase RecG